MKVEWSSMALLDLVKIKEYIAKNSPDTAAKFVRSLYVSSRDLLKQFPNIGRVIPEKGDPKFRELIHGNYRIMYKLSAGKIEILTIRNSNQLYREI